MRSFRIFALSLLATTLSGCAQQPPRFHHAGLAEDYQYGEFDYVANRRDIRLAVIGYPFTAPETKKSFTRIIETWIWGKNQGPKGHFTANPGPSHRLPYSVVMVFNPDHAMSPRELCLANESNTKTMAPGTTSLVSIQAAFCRGDKPLSVTSSAREDISSPLDETFGLLISDTAYILFPRPVANCASGGASGEEPDFGKLNH
ncbi:MAG TPA: hypothetical protein DCW68_06025 [Rhodospirillaceae bacterium]|nr:MAG: hypothetical protein A2018_03590 [Alphaproteobacteria bacterium GWF2_58_20]HAU29651.1 hypothetical protein [Rhodospirillaceae bacterium]